MLPQKIQMNVVRIVIGGLEEVENYHNEDDH